MDSPSVMYTAWLLYIRYALDRHRIRFVVHSDVQQNPEYGRCVIGAERPIVSSVVLKLCQKIRLYGNL